MSKRKKRKVGDNPKLVAGLSRRIMTEDEKNRLVLRVTQRFLKSGIQIKDVYGNLAD